MNQQFFTLIALIYSSAILFGCDNNLDKDDKRTTEFADTVLFNGNIITVDEILGQQQAIAIRGHTIYAVGTNQDIRQLIGTHTKTIDLAGRSVIPGLIEGHGHFLGLGRAQQILDLSTANNYADIVQQVAKAVDSAAPGEWIFGRGWHQDKWRHVPSPNIDGIPIHNGLSAISPNNPVVLGHASGHATFVNAAAMRAAGMDKQTEDPPGGTLVRDPQGNLTGMLRETAQRLVMQAADAETAKLSPELRRQLTRDQVLLAGKLALRHGITSFHDAGATFSNLNYLQEFAEQDALPIRLYVMVRDRDQASAEQLQRYYTPYNDNSFLVVRSIKHQIDGALGAHGAWLLQPYEDLADSSGLVLESIETIEQSATLASELGYQINTHAIGTRANREVLNLYQRVWQENNIDGKALRWRIEHAQHIHPTDVPRFAELGVIAAMQGIHCTSDGPWLATRLGEKRTAQTSYLWRDLVDSGAVVGNGTDTPVEPINPFASIAATETRLMNNGEAFYPEQALSREEALFSYTMANAYAAFEENHKGSLTPGKLADLVVLSDNFFTTSAAKLKDIQVHYTFVGGDIRYELTTQR